MKIFTVFIALCLLVACSFLTDHSFIDSPYYDDTSVVLSAYDHSNNETVSVINISLPIDEFLNDNQMDLSLVDTKIKEGFYSVEGFSSSLSSLASSFVSFGEDLSSLVSDASDPSLGYQYLHDPGYRTFANTYVSYLNSLYNKADITVLERYVYPRYTDYISQVKSFLTSSSYLSAPAPELGSWSTWSTHPNLLFNAYEYFIHFGVSPRYHLSIQDQLEQYHVSSPFIDSSFLQNGVYPIYIRSFYVRSSIWHSSLSSTNYVYNPTTGTIYESN